MEDLNKSIDSLIDELFADEAPKADSVVKSMIKDKNPAKDTADEAVNAAPKAEKDEKRPDSGRPKQISEVPQVDTDGKRDSEYDKAITQDETDKDGKKKEDEQVKAPELMIKKSLSDNEWNEYQELKKAKAAAEQAETLQKARKETSDLIKSAVSEALAGSRQENESLKKSLQEQGELIKAMANKPQKSKSITNVQQVEKFQKSQSASMSKADVLDVAEDLVKSKKLDMNHVIELENTGYIYDAEARGILEREVARRNK